MKQFFIRRRVRTLVLGLILVVLGTVVGTFFGAYGLLIPSALSWDMARLLFMFASSVGPFAFGVWLLTDLCRGTDEDRKQWEETRRVIREFDEQMEAPNRELHLITRPTDLELRNQP